MSGWVSAALAGRIILKWILEKHSLKVGTISKYDIVVFIVLYL
jgi:hypothetical protein